MIEAPKSRYEQIADLLHQRIAERLYPPGSLLPSEPELSAELGVSRVTVNRAVGLLRTQGLVRVRRGTGTYVRSLPSIVRDARSRYARRNRGTAGGAAAEVAAVSLQPRTEYPQIGRTTATPGVAWALKISEGDEVLARRRVLYGNDEPVQIADSYYPWHLVANTPLREKDTGPAGSYGQLAQTGIEIVRFIEYVTVRAPSTNERAVLRLEGGQQVFDLVHVALTADEVRVEASFHVLPGHLWTLRYDWDDPLDEAACVSTPTAEDEPAERLSHDQLR